MDWEPHLGDEKQKQKNWMEWGNDHRRTDSNWRANIVVTDGLGCAKDGGSESKAIALAVWIDRLRIKVECLGNWENYNEWWMGTVQIIIHQTTSARRCHAWICKWAPSETTVIDIWLTNESYANYLRQLLSSLIIIINLSIDCIIQF